jgi:hypothetical protein
MGSQTFGIPEDTLAQQLMNEYSLVVLTTQQVSNIQPPTFNNYEDANLYIQNMLSQLQNWPYSRIAEVNEAGGGIELSTNSNKINKKNTANLVPIDCYTPGTRWASIPGSGGLLSTFNFYFSTSSTGIIGTDFYTTGTNIGWSWNQINSFNSGFSGCTAGTITWGLQIGNFVIGVEREYHWNYSFNQANCTMNINFGSGPC